MSVKVTRFVISAGILALLAGYMISCDSKPEKQQRRPAKNTETLEVLGALPKEVIHPEDNLPTDEKTALGRLLFYDPVLSGNKDVSCATCHQPNFNYAEFMETSIGVNGRGRGSKRQFISPNDIPFVKRNSQSILNTAFNGIRNGERYHAESAPMFWDLRAKGLEEQALIPVKTLEEMRGRSYGEDEIIDAILERIRQIPEYGQLFSDAFPEDEQAISEKNMAKAIAAYERTLVANNSRFDQYMRGDSGAISTAEKEGLHLFLKTGCAKCHSGPMFSDFKMHTLGAPDTQNITESDAGINQDYAFRTPTLRNLRYSAPYMHSGKFNTLEQVLQFYEDIAGGKIRNPNVTAAQMDTLATNMRVNFKDISRIVEFLNCLNDDNFDKSIPDKVPSGLPVMGL